MQKVGIVAGAVQFRYTQGFVEGLANSAAQLILHFGTHLGVAQKSNVPDAPVFVKSHFQAHIARGHVFTSEVKQGVEFNAKSAVGDRHIINARRTAVGGSIGRKSLHVVVHPTTQSVEVKPLEQHNVESGGHQVGIKITILLAAKHPAGIEPFAPKQRKFDVARKAFAINFPHGIVGIEKPESPFKVALSEVGLHLHPANFGFVVLPLAQFRMVTARKPEVGVAGNFLLHKG